jgi:transposase
MVFVGLDWASTAHAVCVLDPTGTVQWRGSVPHSAEGLAELVRRLRQFGPPATVRVAIERPSGVVIDTLMDAGVQVVPIHPNVVKATRARYSAAPAKSDDGDSYLLADLLRTDGHRFRPLHPLADETRALRALVRGRDDLVGQRVALANQLRALLERFWPGAAVTFADVDSPIALAFLARYPTPQSAERVGERRLAQFLRRHAYCGRRPAAELLGRLRGAPVGRAGEAECDASGELVRSLVAVLVPLVAQIQQLSAAIAAALADHPDGPLLQSLPRSGQVNAAQLLAERTSRYPVAPSMLVPPIPPSMYRRSPMLTGAWRPGWAQLAATATSIGTPCDPSKNLTVPSDTSTAATLTSLLGQPFRARRCFTWTTCAASGMGCGVASARFPNSRRTVISSRAFLHSCRQSWKYCLSATDRS